MPDPKPESKPKPKPAANAPAAWPPGKTARAMVSHYLKQDDETFVTYGKGSVLHQSQLSEENWAYYLAHGQLELVSLDPIRLDPDDGYYMPPINAIHAQED